MIIQLSFFKGRSWLVISNEAVAHARIASGLCVGKCGMNYSKLKSWCQNERCMSAFQRGGLGPIVDIRISAPC